MFQRWFWTLADNFGRYFWVLVIVMVVVLFAITSDQFCIGYPPDNWHFGINC